MSDDQPQLQMDKTIRDARAAYSNDLYPVRNCNYCGCLYRGPAVYCSLDCALLDSGAPDVLPMSPRLVENMISDARREGVDEGREAAAKMVETWDPPSNSSRWWPDMLTGIAREIREGKSK